ncbi:SigE family RNA polymerase sigma factor [Embleya scabrispora]|uniref:SigE family RNA polymerase sigma factor n=1 Tax=Embleya scabrispora TaxID=159449 RepID=UPI00036939FC|nr:SigE family RNA polymerase sigma factor [Embleya scabrispora]MYS87494.1 SigE family RNA polymerase sigma factor [Streptomyces sp. SID5474]
MRPEKERLFDEFVTARYHALRRTAYLLCGDWHQAEDLVQTALTKVYATWHRMRDTDAVDSYTRRVLVRGFIDTKRLHSGREVLSEAFPDAAATDVDSARRLALLSALGQVSPVYRAVLVLRYWEDQSVEETSALLGRSSSAVRSAASRGLEQLRAILGDSVHDIARP